MSQDTHLSLNDLIKEQQILLEKYKRLSEESDLLVLQDNITTLKKQYTTLQEKYNALKKDYDALKKESVNLKMALSEQILSEKMNLLHVSEQKLDTYFSTEDAHARSKLKNIELTLTHKLQNLHSLILQSDSVTELNDELNAFENRVSTLIAAKNQALTTAKNTIHEDLTAKLNNLNSSELSEEIIQRRMKQNNFEFKIGVSLISKIGIFLLLIGLINLMGYSFIYYFNDVMKCLSGLFIGVILALGGDFFYKKEKDILGLSLIGGSIATGYITLFCAYFIFDLLSIPITLLLCILISILALYSSLRYKSTIICGFGIVGGYLPFLTLILPDTFNQISLYIFMLYLILLNMTTLYLSRTHDSNFLHYLSYILNLPVLFFIIDALDTNFIAIIYCMVIFFMYTYMILRYPFKYMIKLSEPKIILLILNTIISCGMLLYLMLQFRGLIAIFFALLYALLAYLAKKHLASEPSVNLLFKITSIAFFILIVPFQFDFIYLTTGWIIEGLLLLIYGTTRKNNWLKKMGNIIFVFSLIAFYIFIFNKEFLQCIIEFTLLTLGMCLTLYNKWHKRLISNFPSFVAILHIWCYTFYILDVVLLKKVLLLNAFLDRFTYVALLYPLILLAISAISKKLSHNLDKDILVLTIINYSCTILYCPILTLLFSSSNSFQLCLLIALNLSTLFALRWLTKYYILSYQSREWYPITVSLILLLNSTILLTAQFNLSFSNATIGIFYLILAFCFILYGFKRSYRWIRYLGLILSIISIGKLLLIDLGGKLQGIWSILVYFVFGAILLSISYVYQKFKKI